MADYHATTNRRQSAAVFSTNAFPAAPDDDDVCTDDSEAIVISAWPQLEELLWQEDVEVVSTVTVSMSPLTATAAETGASAFRPGTRRPTGKLSTRVCVCTVL